MMRLGSILFSIIATTLAGVAIIVSLVLGFDTLKPILVAAGVGFVAAVPATWLVTRMVADSQ